MQIFSEYWGQIKSFYRVYWQILFARQRNLDGDLSEYVMKPGYIWTVWFYLGVFAGSVIRVPLEFVRSVLLVIGLLACFILFCISPLVILSVFPVFTFLRNRRIKKAGAAL